MSKIKTLADFFEEELTDIYSAEKQLTKALPKMAKNATSPELKKGFEKHLKETQEHVARIEKIAKKSGITLGRKKCKAMEGLIEEASEILEEDIEPAVLDVALICAAQKVEHYEIATYGSLKAIAEELGEDEAFEILNTTLEEEVATDETLSELSNEINATANAEPVEA
jgi:ferritin-like metal-binding protein YciE